MKDDANPPFNEAQTDIRGKEGTTPAERALAEAAERRAKTAQQGRTSTKEINGPKGPEPTRYGDWEKGGIASDF